mgnify:CR=1 FL=1
MGGSGRKLILAIVSNDDSSKVSSRLNNEGFSVTRLATTGGFLMSGNTSLLIGTDDQNLDRVLDLIKTNCKKRSRMVPSSGAYGMGGMHAPLPVEVSVGGATVFVLDIERFEKI